MPGFCQDELALSALILNHRRKPEPAAFDALPGVEGERALKLCALLRIAVRLHRSRSPRPLAHCDLHVRKREMRLAFELGWLEHHALSRANPATRRACNCAGWVSS